MLASHLESFILSQFLGLYMLIVAVIMFSRIKAYRQLIQNVDPDSGTLLLGGLIGLLIGMFLVLVHNIWVYTPVVVLTVICWLILIFSIMVLSMPERIVSITRKLFLSSGYYWIILIMGIMGLMFLVRGVYVYVTRHTEFLILPSIH